MVDVFRQRYPLMPKAEWWKCYNPIVDVDFNIESADKTDIVRIEDDTYIRRCTFDCALNGEDRKNISQPLKGLLMDDERLSIRTMYFDLRGYEPKVDDKIKYRGKMWNVEEIKHTYIYMPRERSFLHLTLTGIAEKGEKKDE